MMNEDKDWQEEFDSLPFESQMKVSKIKDNLRQLIPNLPEASRRSQVFDALLECARNIKDAKVLCATLFSGAEYFDKLKPLPPDEGYPQERAKELDWLRHVASDNIGYMEDAVDAIECCIGGDFKSAWQVFGKFRCREAEFKAITAYWEEALGS